MVQKEVEKEDIKNTKKRLPPTKERLRLPCPPMVSLGTTALNILKALKEGGNSHNISKELNCSRTNVQKHLKKLRDKYHFASKEDDNICSVWEVTPLGIAFLGGQPINVMYDERGATYLQDRAHNIKVKFPIIEQPKTLSWVTNWKPNKIKNNVFYHQTFGDIQITYTGKSLIFQLPILNFKSSELALAEAGRIAFSLARKYQTEVPDLKLGKEEITSQLITQHHACVNDPYALFCSKHGISYRDEVLDIDASNKQIPEIEFTDSEMSHIHHQRHVDNIKDIVLNKAPTNKEINEQIKNILSLLEEQQKANTDTSYGLSSITNVLNNKLKEENTFKKLKTEIKFNYEGYIG